LGCLPNPGGNGLVQKKQLPLADNLLFFVILAHGGIMHRCSDYHWRVKMTSKIHEFMRVEQVSGLFNALPDVSFFVKDRQSQFVHVNDCFVRLHGFSDASDMIGKQDFDFHPPALAAEYFAEDNRVMESGNPVYDQTELVTHHSGMPRWYLITKLPLSDSQNNIIGLAGVMRQIDQPGDNAPNDYQRLTPSLEYAFNNCCHNISIPEMAKKSDLSTSQLQRDFRKLFRMSPGEYVMRLRLQLAQRQLINSNNAVGKIASDCGFFDQSHFTRAFRKHTGLSPSQYRSKAWMQNTPKE
jgi:PAS domain S-box-containing protein